MKLMDSGFQQNILQNNKTSLRIFMFLDIYTIMTATQAKTKIILVFQRGLFALDSARRGAVFSASPLGTAEPTELVAVEIAENEPDVDERLRVDDDRNDNDVDEDSTGKETVGALAVEFEMMTYCGCDTTLESVWMAVATGFAEDHEYCVLVATEVS